MADFGRRWRGIGRREPEIPLERVQHCTWPNRIDDKSIRHKVDPGERRVRSLDGQRGCDLLRWARQHVGDRNVSRLLEVSKAGGLIERRWTHVVVRPADRVEHGLARRQEAKAMR